MYYVNKRIHMKYLVVKGWLGFGDRLESLKMGVAYAQAHNLQIFVDWSDSIWSHGSESFYTYFNLLMPSLKSLNDIPANATYYPPYWKENINKPFSQELFDKQKELGLQLGVLNKPYNADVVVLSSIGNRTIYDNSDFFARVFRVVDPRIRDIINLRKSQHPLSNSLGFHIRGTDRTKTRFRKEYSIQLIAVNAVMHGSFSGQPMITVSDDKESLEIWKRFYPDTTIFSSVSLDNSTSKGIHNANKNEIKVLKDILNLDMLVDFFTLASCKRILSTFRDSRFAKEAERLSPYTNRILGNE